MKNLKIVTLGLIAGLSLTACGEKEQFGTFSGVLAGGIAGAALGETPTATILGALIGGFIGQQIGASLDRVDRQRAAEAQYRALQFGIAGQPYVWSNPNTGHHGQVVVGPYMDAGMCRHYTHTIYIGGRPEVASGVACRRVDGTWAVRS